MRRKLDVTDGPRDCHCFAIAQVRIARILDKFQCRANPAVVHSSEFGGLKLSTAALVLLRTMTDNIVTM